LLQHVGRFGCPTQILSDNGPQYVNELIKEFTKLVGTEYLTTLAYSKEENAIVERANKEVLRHLRAIIFDKNIIDKWSRDTIPFIQRIINSSIDSSIGVSPAQILFGNSIQLDNGIFLPLPQINDTFGTISFSKWSDQMINTQNLVIAAAQKSQRNKDSQHIASKPPERSEFKNGSYVLVKYNETSLKPGPPNKMMANLRGPLQVVSHVGNTYTLRNLLTNKHEKCHITQLRKFEYATDQVDPFDIAAKDAQEHVVEKILNHSGVPSDKTNMQFEVCWKGESHENNLWLDWKELRNNPILHQYLIEHKMKSIIPLEFKQSKNKIN
jgi:hypothetical protein